MKFEVYKKNGMGEILMGTYEADTPEKAKELADKDVNYGWYVSKVVVPETVTQFKVTYLTPISKEEDFQMVFAKNKEEAGKQIFASEILSIEEFKDTRKNNQLINALSQLKNSMEHLSNVLDGMDGNNEYNVVIDNYINTTFDKFDLPTNELNDVIQAWCSNSIEELK